MSEGRCKWAMGRAVCHDEPQGPHFDEPPNLSTAWRTQGFFAAVRHGQQPDRAEADGYQHPKRIPSRAPRPPRWQGRPSLPVDAGIRYRSTGNPPVQGCRNRSGRHSHPRPSNRTRFVASEDKAERVDQAARFAATSPLTADTAVSKNYCRGRS